MDLKKIRTFRTIVKYGDFQGAAKELNYAQSTITTHIKNLEEELGVILIERGSELRLTEAGRLLYEKGDILLKGFDSLQAAMEELINGEAGTIRIGVMEPTASFRFPIMLQSFFEKYPKVTVNIQIHSVKVLNEMMAKGEIDLALCAAPESQQSGIFEPLFNEEVVLLMPQHHPLSEKEEIVLQDLEKEQLLMTSPFCPFRRNLERQMIKVGINPQYGFEVSNLMALKQYVIHGFGIAIVPIITVNPPPEGTVIKYIENFNRGFTVGIMRNDEYFYKSKALEYLIDAIHKGIEKIQHTPLIDPVHSSFLN